MVLEHELEMDTALICGGYDAVPALCRRQIDLAQLLRLAARRPIEVLSIPVRHPDAGPVLARGMHLAEDVGIVCLALRAPRDVVADREVALAVVHDEAAPVAAIESHEPRLRLARHVPRALLDLLRMCRLAVQADRNERIGAGSGGRVAHAPGRAAVEEAGHADDTVVRPLERDLDVHLLIVVRIALKARKLERGLYHRVGAEAGDVEELLLARVERAVVAGADVAARVAVEAAIVLRASAAGKRADRRKPDCRCDAGQAVSSRHSEESHLSFPSISRSAGARRSVDDRLEPRTSTYQSILPILWTVWLS